MNVLENIVDMYCTNKIDILLLCSISFIQTIICCIDMDWENRKYNINKWLRSLFGGIAVCFIGNIFCLMQEEGMICVESYFCAIVFFMLIGVVAIYEIIQCIQFGKIKPFISQGCRYIRYITFMEIVLLTITGHLEMIEFVVGVLGIVACEAFYIIVDNVKDNSKDKIDKESDYPDKELYHSREKQLEKFIKILEQQKKEPYAIMISAEWGSGKSSFVQALEEKMEESCFVWIEAGSEKDVTQIMLEISQRILEVLRRNNVYIEKENLIENYFLAFAEVFNENGFKIWSKITNLIDNDSRKEQYGKKYINKKLEELKKSIFLVIDDLDRCEKEYQDKMFKVIRESVELTNCKTIFLVDKKKFLVGACNDEVHDNDLQNNGLLDLEYVEKYVSYTLDLCHVSYEEIVKHHIEKFFNEEFLEKTAPLLRRGNINDIGKIVYDFPVNILDIFEFEIQKDKSKSETRTKDIEEKYKTIKNNITNPRKVKRYLRGVKSNILKLDLRIVEYAEQGLIEDWIDIIVKEEFVKYFLPEEFVKIQNCQDIYEYIERYGQNSNALLLILDMNFKNAFYGEKKKEILHYVIYDLDSVDYTERKTHKNEILNELRGEKVRFNHINEYVNYAESYYDYNRILDVYDLKEIKTEMEKELFIKSIFRNISKLYMFPYPNTREFLDLSDRLIYILKKNGLSEKQKEVCILEGKAIVQNAILENGMIFKNILYIFFSIDQIEREWEKQNANSIDELYLFLKRIDDISKFEGLYEGANKLLSIEAYYLSMEEELKNGEYAKVEIDFSKKFEHIKIVLEICKFWYGVKAVLDEANTEPFLEKYFNINGYYAITDEVFVNGGSLLHALYVLSSFYEMESQNFKSDYSNMLVQILHRVVDVYETNGEWFIIGASIEEVIKEIDSAAEKVYMYDPREDVYAKETVDHIRILIYRLKCLYEDKMGVICE